MFLCHLFARTRVADCIRIPWCPGEVACFTQGGAELGQTTGKDGIYNCAVAVLLKNHLMALSLALLCIKYIFKSFNECEVKINGMKNDGVAFAAPFLLSVFAISTSIIVFQCKGDARVVPYGLMACSSCVLVNVIMHCFR